MQNSSLPNQVQVLFNPMGKEFTEDPEQFYAPIREQTPVFFLPQAGFWVLTRHSDIVTMTRDPRFTPDSRAWRFARPSPYKEGSELAKIFNNNPFHGPAQDHLRIRKLVAPAFSPSAISQLETQVRAIADDLIDRVVERGDGMMDVATDLAAPMPARAIAAMFAIPREYEAAFGRWGYAVIQQVMLAMTAPHRLGETMAEAEAGVPMLRQIIAERRRKLGDDVLSRLIQAQEASDKLTEDELVAVVAIIIAAGTDTSVHMISFAVLNLLRHEAELGEIRRDLSLLPNAIEEIMRYDSQSKATIPRVALEDLTLGGQSIAKGDLVVGFVGAALRDRSVWPDADRFDIKREPIGNLSFGHGPHYCLGAQLARLECRATVEALLERFPRMQLAAPPEYAHQHPIHRAITSLKVALHSAS